MESFFQILNSNFWLKTKISKRITRCENWSKCNVLYINVFVYTSSTKYWIFFELLAENRKTFNALVLCKRGGEAFVLISTHPSFKFQICFQNFGWKPKNIRTNREAWILIKVQCSKYQWIRLDKLYKLMESFFQILNQFSNYWPKT